MNEANIIQQGLILTVMGMGFVFLFLTGMILSMKCLKYTTNLLDKYWPQNMTVKQQLADYGTIAAAIAAAKNILNK
ncbi:MAG: OadG family protein [Elusimicrobiota bacterium]|jgi:Na+-transporting methylmalonyl-CoA/oxaloacetate decarboxylase gamma subunit|nr:OadG family protein [Elusimicrobiota bacterium]